MRSGYLWNCLVAICLTQSGKEGMLQMSPVKEFQLAESRKGGFSAIAPALWNILPPEPKWTPILLTFQKSSRLDSINCRKGLKCSL